MSSFRPHLPPALLAIFVTLLQPVLHAAQEPSWLNRLTRDDVDVIAVTDVSDAGRAFVPATSAKPVYFKFIYLGQKEFGRSWAGETLPEKNNVIAWILGAMKDQGYLLADELHPPEQLLVFGWGMLAGSGGRPALRFLGGEKVNLMWEQENAFEGILHENLTLEARLLTATARRGGVAGKIWDAAGTNLFLCVVRSYTLESETAEEPTQLWETRFACPSNGVTFDRAMPLLIKAASLNFGRETKLPVTLNASEAYEGHVKLGELQVLDDAEAPNKTQAKPENSAK